MNERLNVLHMDMIVGTDPRDMASVLSLSTWNGLSASLIVSHWSFSF